MFSWKIDKNACILFIRIFRFSTLNDMRVKKKYCFRMANKAIHEKKQHGRQFVFKMVEC